MKDRDIDYLDEKFPKGKDNRRGEAMVLMALARMEGRPDVILDEEFDIIYSNWGQTEHSKELENVTIILDFDKGHNIVGFEIWDFGKRLEEAIERDNIIFDLPRYRMEMRLNCISQDFDYDENKMDQIILGDFRHGKR